MKKIIIALFFMSVSTVFAKNNLIKPNNANTQESIHWEFGKNNGMFFLLGPESQQKLFIQVDKTLPNNLIPDPITVVCNNQWYQLKPEQSVTCHPNFSNVVSINIAPQDFKSGSAGIYQYLPIKNNNR